jgi:hypothetical protein
VQAINDSLDKARANLTVLHKPTGTTSPDLSAKRRMLLANVWQVLLSRRLVTDPVGSDAYKVFERDMADLSDAQIRAGMDRAKDFTGFFTFPAFRELCHVKPEDLGLPNAKQAYIEACNKPLPWERQKWSHAAVFHAARETGRFELHSFTESQFFPLFRANYEAMCKRAMEGESLDMPVARMLPERVPQPVSKEEAKRRCASILESIP